MSRICDVTHAADHVVRFTRPSGPVFAYCKQSKTGAREGLGTRLAPGGWGEKEPGISCLHLCMIINC